MKLSFCKNLPESGKNVTYLIAIILATTIINNNVFAQKTNILTDSRDGKKYKTVKIGEQIWTAENLAYKTDSGSWSYNNNDSNIMIYGRLYDFETAKKVCPAGWHLPTYKEWITLINYVGGNNAGGNIKSKSNLWHTPNTGADNITGFGALPGGCRFNDNNGVSGYLTFYAYFWTATSDNKKASQITIYSSKAEAEKHKNKKDKPKNARQVLLYYKKGNALNLNSNITNGCSVRCVKN